MAPNLEDLFDQGLDRFNLDLYDEAGEVFTEVLELNPDHPDALYYRALAWFHKGDFDRAITDFTRGIEKNPQGSCQANFAVDHLWCGSFNSSPVILGSTFYDCSVKAASAMVFRLFAGIFLYIQYVCRNVHGDF